MDAGFDLSDSETDGSGDFGLSESDEEDETTAAASSRGAAGAKPGTAEKNKAAMAAAMAANPDLRLALAIRMRGVEELARGYRG